MDSAEETAVHLLEAVPLVMRAIRVEMRRHRAAGLSVVHFRTLAFLEMHEGASLTDVADHIGLTLPSMSKLIEGLVARRLARRAFDVRDRRRVTLSLTARGGAVLNSARTSTRLFLADRLSALPARDRTSVARSMRILRSVFSTGGEAARGRRRPRS